MRSLKEILVEYKETKALADSSPDEGPYATRTGRAIAIADAQARLTRLRAEYQATARVFPFFVFGPPAKQHGLAKLMEPELIGINGAEIYERLARRIRPTVGPSRTFGADQLGSLILELRDIGADLGIQSMPSPKLTYLVAVEGDTEEAIEASLVGTCRRLVQEVLDQELLTQYLAKQVREAGLAQDRDDDVLPVLILGLDDAEVLVLEALPVFGGRCTEINLAPDETLDGVTRDKVLQFVLAKLSPKENP